MKAIKLSITFATLGIIGATAFSLTGNVVRAAEIDKKDTKTQVEITDSPDPDTAVLKLNHVPEVYSFKTKLSTDGTYSINGADIGKDDKNNNITVFNDKVKQDWSVKASVTNDKLATEAGGKSATVTQFKINGQDLMGENASPIIFAAQATKSADNNTGELNKPITADGLSIEFNNEKHDLKSGDVLTGTVHYQLFDTPTAS